MTPAPFQPTFRGTVHLVFSSHWDREWYFPFQKFRGKLVAVLDTVLDALETGRLSYYQMDGQFIPVEDYLEIRPEREELIRRLVVEGRLKLGPWYNLPDEFLVSGESLVRNFLLGMKLAEGFGETSRVGWLCDIFGHNSQMPQILAQLGIDNAILWRGVDPATPTPLRWRGADGTEILASRFPENGYADFGFDVRKINEPDVAPTVAQLMENMVAYLKKTEADSHAPDLLWFDGGDHMEFDPAVLAAAAGLNERAGCELIKVSTLDRFIAALRNAASEAILAILEGELRVPATMQTKGWLIPGVGSSRIPLKQANHACETLLTLWAEPWCAAANAALGLEYPATALDLAWKYLLKNHPHDSICGCSPDETHADMPYRFAQSRQIAEYHVESAFNALAREALVGKVGEGEIGLSLFTPASGALQHGPEVFIRLPKSWPQFNEFLGYESKPSIRIEDLEGREIAWQLLQVVPSTTHLRVPEYHFPAAEERQGVRLALDTSLPAATARHFVIKRAEGPTRIAQEALIGIGRDRLRNEFLEVVAAGDGTLMLTDRASGQTYSGLFALEDTADIGDGWFHGIALQDQAFLSTGGKVTFGITENGPLLARLKIRVEWEVPAEFDFHKNERSARFEPLIVEHRVTLRKGASHLEIDTTVSNSIRDHRLRLLCPTGLADARTFWADTPFDAVERPIELPRDRHLHRELQVEMTPQQNWVATADGGHGLALIAPGQYESAVLDQPDRPLCLTLLRAFRKAVFTDGNEGGQIQGTHQFRLALKPFSGQLPAAQLFRIAQALAAPVRVVALERRDLRSPAATTPPAAARPTASLPRVTGPIVLSACQRLEEKRWLFRIFNPANEPVEARLENGTDWHIADLRGTGTEKIDGRSVLLRPKQILTLAAGLL